MKKKKMIKIVFRVYLGEVVLFVGIRNRAGWLLVEIIKIQIAIEL